MLKDEDIHIEIGRANEQGEDYMKIIHVPTGISRGNGPPLGKGRAVYEFQRQALAEIEEELLRRGLHQYLLPDRPGKIRRWTTPRSIDGCPLYSLAITAFEELEEVTWPSPRALVFILADARNVSSETITRAAKAMLHRGLVYVCTWGPDCERVHDLFDEAYVWETVTATETPVDRAFTLMTTWHEKDTLAEALRFFVDSAFVPDGMDKSKTSCVAVTIGRDEWTREVQRSLADLPVLRESPTESEQRNR